MVMRSGSDQTNDAIGVSIRIESGYGGTRMTELTDLELMRERSRQIATNPERDKQRNE
jgi:hypothetical protein